MESVATETDAKPELSYSNKVSLVPKPLFVLEPAPEDKKRKKVKRRRKKRKRQIVRKLRKVTVSVTHEQNSKRVW